MTFLGRRDWTDPVVAKPMLDKIPLGKFAGTLPILDDFGSKRIQKKYDCTVYYHIKNNCWTTLYMFSEPEDIADAIIFLLSEKSRMINGITLPVDGGFAACW